MKPSRGFTLLEVLIALAIIAGLLSTIIYTVNTHLDAAGRNEVRTVATLLAWEKMEEIEENPAATDGKFDEPYSSYTFSTTVGESLYPGVNELTVKVTGEDETITLRRLKRQSQ